MVIFKFFVRKTHQKVGLLKKKNYICTTLYEQNAIINKNNGTMTTRLLFRVMATMMAILALAMPASAYDFVKDGIYYNISGTNATVTNSGSYNSYSGTVNIPATVTNNGTIYTVKSVGYESFKNCSALRRVVIPNTVEYMSNYAFQNCTGLTNITIPASMFSIYNSVFDGCTNLKTVICLRTSARSCNVNNFPTDVYTNATLYVPQGSLSSYQSTDCWSQFSKIKEMDCDFVEDAVFYNDMGDNTASVTHAYRFAEDYSGEITIPQTVTHNGTTYTVTRVGSEAFFNSYYLTSLTLPPTVNYLDNYAFYECIRLTNVNIPEGVEYINYCAFGECPSLQNIIIPGSVTWIAQNAFSGCMNLTNITCRATTPPMCVDSSSFPAEAYSNATLYVPSNALSDYQSASVWSNFRNIAAKDYDFTYNNIYYRITSPSTVEVTYKDTNYNTYSGNVTIPSTVTLDGTTYTVTGIGNNAFRASSDLISVSIPNTVTSIGYAAFYDSGLRSITIPNSVTTLVEFCFMSCSSLQSVTLGNSVTSIPRQCFLQCTSLTSINIPGSVEDISYYAFGYCNNLSQVNIQNGVKSLLNNAFFGCTSLQSFSIPASVTTINESVLGGCTSLEAIMVSSANTHYRSYNGVLFTAAMDSLLAFPNMSTTSYQVPASVSVICANAFSYCDNLEEVTLPEGLNAIGVDAFASCEKLTTFSIPASVTTLGSGVFSNCTSLTSIDVAAGNQNFMTDNGVLYTSDGKRLIQYPCSRPDKHYSVLNTAEEIDFLSFSSSTYLKSVYLPSGLRTIPQNTFRQSGIERLVIDEGLETIEMNAFAGCYSLKSIYLPSTLISIENYAFQVNTEVEEITFAGSTPPDIGYNAFYGVGYDVDNLTMYTPEGCGSTFNNIDWNSDYFVFNVAEISPIASGATFTVDSLTYVTTDNNLSVKVSEATSTNLVDPGIPPKVAYQGNLCTVTALGYNSLQNCKKMIRAEVPFTVSWIDDYSFYNCTNIQTMRLHEGIEEIDPFSMSHIDNLTSLSIPASVDSISGTFVTYSSSLQEILVHPANNKYVSVDGVLFSKNRKLLVSYPNAKTSNYTIPYGTEIIGSNSFRGSSHLQQVIIPASVRKIEGSAFLDNTALKEIKVPEGVETIGYNAFYKCSNMTRAELPSTLTSLGYNALANTKKLATLVVNNPTPPTCQTYIQPQSGTIYETFDDYNYANTQLIVPHGCAQAYMNANIWKKFQNIVEADVPVVYMRGDVNNDGQVTIADVSALIDILLDGNDSTNTTADGNLDGDVTIADVSVLIDYLLGDDFPTAGIDMWYLIGSHVGDAEWQNEGDNNIGHSLIPLYPDGEFDAYGKGVLTYTGYFDANDFIAILHTPGNWDDRWGIDQNGNYVHGNSGEANAVNMGTSGYYTITLNTQTNSFSIEPIDGSSIGVFNIINIVGSHDGWDVTNRAFNMTDLNPYKENHDWIFRDLVFTSNGELKLAANNNWDFNWGADQFPWGQGLANGLNIPYEAGTYDVYFNDITGHYHFIKK